MFQDMLGKNNIISLVVLHMLDFNLPSFDTESFLTFRKKLFINFGN